MNVINVVCLRKMNSVERFVLLYIKNKTRKFVIEDKEDVVWYNS